LDALLLTASLKSHKLYVAGASTTTHPKVGMITRTRLDGSFPLPIVVGVVGFPDVDVVRVSEVISFREIEKAVLSLHADFQEIDVERQTNLPPTRWCGSLRDAIPQHIRDTTSDGSY
jgi:hypothetical protein